MSPLWSAVIRALGRDDLSIRANELPELTQTEIDSALTVGLLRPGERPDVTTCTACDEPHPVGIDWIMTPSGEALGALECETASTTTVTEPDVRTLQVVAPWIMSRVAEQLGAAGGIFEAAVGNYWRLGKIRRGDRSFDVVAGVGHTPVDDLVRANEKRVS